MSLATIAVGLDIQQVGQLSLTVDADVRLETRRNAPNEYYSRTPLVLGIVVCPRPWLHHEHEQNVYT
jgi:hypothetical protein